MISINIDHTTTLGQALVRTANALNQDPSEIATGLLFALICKRKRREATPTPSTAAPSAPAEGDAEKGINFLLSLNPQQ